MQNECLGCIHEQNPVCEDYEPYQNEYCINCGHGAKCHGKEAPHALD